MTFVHLHNHTSYSLLDGASRIEDLVVKAKADGQPGIATTDHGNLYSWIPFYKECKSQDINPILGIETYFCEDREVKGVKVGQGSLDGSDKRYYHLSLMAKDEIGYRNLIKLSSEAFLEGFWHKPRHDWGMLEAHSDGLIATTGCLGGIVLQHLLHEDYEGALVAASRFRDIFGKDNLYVELQNHGLVAQRKTNPWLIDIAKRLDLKTICTNDTHYVNHDDAHAHDILLCTQTGSKVKDEKRFRFESDQHYLKTSDEMRHLFSEVPESCDNTLEINERCNVKIDFDTLHLPRFPIPNGYETPSAYLSKLAFDGLLAKGLTSQDYFERLTYELGVIDAMHLSPYFLIVWDLCRFADEQGIGRGPGRGSASGSIVSYCLGITKVDPLVYELSFERFLNPSRVTMADIDLDIVTDRRDELINYTREKYGDDHVAQVITFSEIRARAAVRDAARVLDLPPQVGDKISKAMPELHMGESTPIRYCFEESDRYEFGYRAAEKLRHLYDTDLQVKEVVDVARGLEGLIRQDGIGAAAVVITPDPLTDLVPIQKKPKGPVVTQWDKSTIEELGLLKMDFLGLRNLDIIQDAIRMTNGAITDVDDLPLDDFDTYQLFRSGDTTGVFQCGESGMKALLRKIRPTGINDIAAALALYRPGPMASNMHNDYADRKNGTQPVTYFHPDAEDVLAGTYGLMVFQEDLMKVSQKFAGYSGADADTLRSACLPAGTKLLTRERGYYPIEKIMNLKDRSVQTASLVSFRSQFESIEDVWCVGKKHIFEITTKSGAKISATSDHQFLREETWVPLRDLAPGDLIAVCDKTHTFGNARSGSVSGVRLAALLISEGYYGPKSTGGGKFFCNSDVEMVRLFISCFEDFFGYGYQGNRYTDRNGCIKLFISDAEFSKLKPLIGREGLSGDKVIPDILINSSLRKVSAFLGTYFSGDGWFDRAGMHWCSKSIEICSSIKRMLLRLGVRSSIRASFDKKYQEFYFQVSITHGEDARRAVQSLSDFLTQYKLSKFYEHSQSWARGASAGNFGIPREIFNAELARRKAVTGRPVRQLMSGENHHPDAKLMAKQNVSKYFLSEKLSDIKDGVITWEEVKSIRYVGMDECFDFAMSGDLEWAFAEDVLVHNCSKKKIDAMIAERDKFVSGCLSSGYSEDFANELFTMIEAFAAYGFVKCLTAESRVRTVDGESVSIGEIDARIQSGEQVFLESWVDGGVDLDECLSVNDSGVQEISLVQFDDGSIVRCTADHKLLCADGKYRTVRSLLATGMMCVSSTQSDLRIVSSSTCDREATFSLTMKGPQHNYILENGAVSKNSHAFGYSFIAYQTAYLKAHYPAQYMAAVCASVSDTIERSSLYLYEAKRMGIKISPPDINRSEGNFYAKSDDEILVGLSSVRYINAVTDRILEERNKSPFVSLMDFLKRVAPNLREFKSLAQSGALDEFGSRWGIVSVADELLKQARKDLTRQSESLFDVDTYTEIDIPIQEYPLANRMALEKDVVGIYISGHPLDDYDPLDQMVADVEEIEDGKFVDVLVVVSAVEEKVTKAGARMAILVVEDQTGSVEVVEFPKTFSELGVPVVGDIVRLTIRIGRDRDEQRNYVLHKWSRKNNTEIGMVEAETMKIFLPKGFAQDDVHLSKLKGLILSHHGKTPVSFWISRSTTLKLSEEYGVEVTDEFLTEMKDLFTSFSHR